MAKSFRELTVWKKAIDLTTTIYEFTAEFPKSELYGLTSQMRRAAVSIPSNLAEGSARGTKKDFRQFVVIAKGSNCELQTQLIISRHLDFGDERKREAAEARSNEIGGMLNGLDDYLLAEIKAAAKPLLRTKN